LSNISEELAASIFMVVPELYYIEWI